MTDEDKGKWKDDAYTYATGGDSEMAWLVVILVAILVIAYIVTR